MQPNAAPYPVTPQGKPMKKTGKVMKLSEMPLEMVVGLMFREIDDHMLFDRGSAIAKEVYKRISKEALPNEYEAD